jgi:hypothetical protein
MSGCFPRSAAVSASVVTYPRASHNHTYGKELPDSSLAAFPVFGRACWPPRAVASIGQPEVLRQTTRHSHAGAGRRLHTRLAVPCAVSNVEASAGIIRRDPEPMRKMPDVLIRDGTWRRRIRRPGRLRSPRRSTSRGAQIGATA